MANIFFRFKQFTIQQDKCAMKVCTDSCILGAYAPLEKATRLLDIGTGTGLLALMAAQRAPQATIEAVEIDSDAAWQAQENVAQSPWPERVQVHHLSLQQFAETKPQPFDFIISNPPFYQASLKSANAAKNTAKHTGELQFEDLLEFVKQYLVPEGKFSILLPPAEAAVFEKLAKRLGLHPQDVLQVYTTPTGKHVRSIHTYSFTPADVTQHTLVIREKDGSYTAPFRNLLQDFYLIF